VRVAGVVAGALLKESLVVSKTWIQGSLLSLLLVLVAPAFAQLPDFTGLVERVSPAVVNISAQRSAAAPVPGGPGEEEVPEIFRRFFGQPGVPPMPRERTSMGTGFLISADGYVLTNHHVVDGASEIYVRLTDRRELKAELVGSDEQTDIAVLKLEGRGFPHVALGKSRALKPGQWVVAIGSPFGFDHSVTAGIVSAVGRASFDRSQQYVPFIQTDVAINRGNSGGPLLNTAGEVVGVNSQIFSNTGGFMGVSFAIPIETAMRSAEQLKTQGYVSRGLLGVNIQDVGRDDAKALGLSRTGGALVSGFSEGSAAEKAGIRIQDVIVRFNGEEVRSASDLPPLVGATPPGSKAKVEVLREGKTLSFEVLVAEAPRNAQSGGGRAAGSAESTALGLVVEDIDAEQRALLELEEGQGVVISRVLGGAAQRAGLQGGDIVLMVGRTRVGSVEAFREAAAVLPEGEPVMLLIRRGEQTQFVTLTPDAGR
jgi:serine protease Do